MSATCASLPVACENAQAYLEQAFITAPSMGGAFVHPNEVALNQFLNTPAGRANLLSMYLAPGANKRRTLNAIFSKRGSLDEVTDVDGYDCTATDKSGQCSVEYSLDTDAKKKVELLMELGDLTDHCQGDDYSYFWSKIAEKIATLDRAVAASIATKATTLAATGAWGSDLDDIQGVSASGATLSVRTRLAASGVDGLSPYPFMYEGITSAIQASGWANGVIFSGNAIEQTMRQLMMGCCTDSGASIPDVMAQYGIATVKDMAVAGALASQSKALIFQPGALQLVNFHAFERQKTFGGDAGLINFFYEGGSYQKGFVQSPVTGNIYDIIIKDDCPGAWNVSIYWTGDVFGLPTEMFPTDDRFEGVNYTGILSVSNS